MALGEDFIVISPRNSTETWIEYRIEYGLTTILTLDTSEKKWLIVVNST